jgi:hypothetical protein
MIPIANRELRNNVDDGQNRAIETVYDLTGMGRENERGSESEPIYLALPDEVAEAKEDEEDESSEKKSDSEEDSDEEDDLDEHVHIEDFD